MPRFRRTCTVCDRFVEYDAPAAGPTKNLRDVKAREALEDAGCTHSPAPRPAPEAPRP